MKLNFSGLLGSDRLPQMTRKGGRWSSRENFLSNSLILLNNSFDLLMLGRFNNILPVCLYILIFGLP